MPWLYEALCSTWSLGTKKHLARCGTALFWDGHIPESISPFCFCTKLVYFWWAPIQTGICLAKQTLSHTIRPKRGFIFRSSMHIWQGTEKRSHISKQLVARQWLPRRWQDIFLKSCLPWGPCVCSCCIHNWGNSTRELLSLFIRHIWDGLIPECA